MEVWVISVICLMLTAGLALVLVMRSHEQAMKLVKEQAESHQKQQMDLLNKLVTMLGTKDPLAYQAVALISGQESAGFETVSMSDQAEAARLSQWYEDQGLETYDGN